MNERHEQQAEQRRDKKSDAEIHDRFDHDFTPPHPPPSLPRTRGREGSGTRHDLATRTRTAPLSPRVNLNRLLATRHRLLLGAHCFFSVILEREQKASAKLLNAQHWLGGDQLRMAD